MPFLRFIPVTSISAENVRGVGLAPVTAPLAAFRVNLPARSTDISSFGYLGILSSAI